MKEIRKLIASIFLQWAFSVLPDGEFKQQYRKFLLQWIMTL